MSFYGPPSVLRKATVAASIAVAIAAGALYMNVTKQTPTGESAARYLQCWRSSSGSALCVTETGTLSGTTIDVTGTIPTASDFDPRYVNTSGDTMTGALKVRANLSGSSLNVDNLMSCSNLQTNASGLLACNATSYQAITPYSAAVVGSGAVIKETVLVLSNPSTLAVTGTTILSFKIRSFSGNLIGIRATSTTAGSGVTIDVNLGGDTALTTKLTIDEDETDTDTAAAAAVISATAENKASDEAITIDIDACGATGGAANPNGAKCPKGLTLNLIWQATSYAY